MDKGNASPGRGFLNKTGAGGKIELSHISPQLLNRRVSQSSSPGASVKGGTGTPKLFVRQQSNFFKAATVSYKATYKSTLTHEVSEATANLARAKLDWRQRLLRGEHLKPQEIDALKRLMHQRRQRISRWSLFFFLVGIVAFVLGNEAEYAWVVEEHGPCSDYSVATGGQQFLIYLFQAIVTLASVGATVTVALHNFTQFHLRILSKRYGPHQWLCFSEWGFFLFLEGIVCLLHVPVGPNGCWYSRTNLLEEDYASVWSPIHILNIMVVLRGYLVFRFIGENNRFATSSASMVLSLYSKRNSPVLAFKDFLSDQKNGAMFFVGAYFGVIAVCAYGFLSFERHAQYHPSQIFPIEYATALWYIWYVVTSVGLGDVVVVTPFGRVVSVLAGFLGNIVSACIISYVFSILTLSVAEQKVSFTLDWMAHRSSLPTSAALCIQAWWRLKLAGPYATSFMKSDLYDAMAQWRIRRMRHHRFKNSPTDPSDLLPKLLEVVNGVDSTTETVNAVRAELGAIRAENREILDILRSRGFKSGAIMGGCLPVTAAAAAGTNGMNAILNNVLAGPNGAGGADFGIGIGGGGLSSINEVTIGSKASKPTLGSGLENILLAQQQQQLAMQQHQAQQQQQGGGGGGGPIIMGSGTMPTPRTAQLQQSLLGGVTEETAAALQFRRVRPVDLRQAASMAQNGADGNSSLNVPGSNGRSMSSDVVFWNQHS